MSYSGDAAEQVVRMSLEGAEVAAKITGAGAKQVAVLLYAILREQKKTKGKTRLTNMLRSGKELKVFAVKDTDLKQFCEASKKYGVKSEIERSRHEKAAEEFPEPERCVAESDKTAQLVDSMLQKPDKEQEGHTPNPAQARTTKSPQSEPISRPSERSERDISNRERVRPSVRQELKDIKAEQAAKAAEKAKDRAEKMPATEHHAPKKKRRKRKER